MPTGEATPDPGQQATEHTEGRTGALSLKVLTITPGQLLADSTCLKLTGLPAQVASSQASNQTGDGSVPRPWRGRRSQESPPGGVRGNTCARGRGASEGTRATPRSALLRCEARGKPPTQPNRRREQPWDEATCTSKGGGGDADVGEGGAQRFHRNRLGAGLPGTPGPQVRDASRTPRPSEAGS